jgi:hypothetical protein
VGRFTFTSPEGQTYDVDGPEGATKDDAWKILQQRLSAGSQTLKPQRSALAPVEDSGGGIRSLISDVGTGLASGSVTAAEDVNEIARRAPGAAFAPKLLAAGLDAMSARRGLPSGAEGATALKDLRTQVESNYSPEFREAGAKEWWDSKNKTFGPAWSDPNAYAKGVLESLPEQVLTMFPALKLAKGAFLTKLGQGRRGCSSQGGRAHGANRWQRRRGRARRRAVVARGARRDHGHVRRRARQSDAVKALMKQGMTLRQAKRHRRERRDRAFVLAGVTTGIFGGMGDRALAHAMFGGDKLLAPRVQGRGRRGPARGVPAELPATGLAEHRRARRSTQSATSPRAR